MSRRRGVAGRRRIGGGRVRAGTRLVDRSIGVASRRIRRAGLDRWRWVSGPLVAGHGRSRRGRGNRPRRHRGPCGWRRSDPGRVDRRRLRRLAGAGRDSGFLGNPQPCRDGFDDLDVLDLTQVVPVTVNHGLTFDFDDRGRVELRHYAFLVDDATFDAVLHRLSKWPAVEYGSGPESGWDREVKTKRFATATLRPIWPLRRRQLRDTPAVTSNFGSIGRPAITTI